MKSALKEWICRLILPRIYDGNIIAQFVTDEVLAQAIYSKEFIQYRPQPELFDSDVVLNGDPFRYTMIALAINRLTKNNIEGSLAEVGVYRGNTARIIHHCAPDRRLYLFDSFEGFHPDEKDLRFRDTSIDYVMSNIGDSKNIIPVKGYVPSTFHNYEDEQFSFVSLDVDKYKSTLASLEFFYPRLLPGGYMFIHDYNSPESNWGVQRAVDQFMEDRHDTLVDIPDRWGSLILCRQANKTPINQQ